MLAKEITSLQHPIVKHLVKLRQDRAYRRTERAALITGKKMILEAASYASFKTLVLSSSSDISFPNNAEQTFYL